MKRFSFCFLSAVFLLATAFFPPSSAGAEQLIENKVKLKNVFVDIHYDKSQVNLVRTEDQNSTKLNLVDNNKIIFHFSS
ncbi:hypothetical protein ACWNXI_01870 [Caldibacillus thermoamylovorans]